jgi:integrase
MRDSNRLSALKVARLKEPGRYADGGGLYLQISRWRTKAWLFRFERHGQERQMGLGPLAVISLADARERARAARRLLLDGQDPIEFRNAERAARRVAAAKGISFQQCGEAYIKAHGASWRNEKHRVQWSSTLKTYAYPVLGKLPVTAIDTALVLKVIEPIWSEKTETANRVRGRIETILDWARARGYRDGDNPARWRGHLDQVLPRKSRIAPTKHRPALPYAAIPAFMQKLRARESLSARALEFLILTAARTNEVIGARWSEIDLQGKLWTVPSTRIKSKREHRVPLSTPAIAILRTAVNGDANAFVFADANGRPLSNMAMLELVRGMDSSGIVVHGFRSSFKDWAAETTRHENIVTEMALAHVVSDATEAAYRRGELMLKRRALMEDWAQYCVRAHREGGNIMKLPRRAP